MENVAGEVLVRTACPLDCPDACSLEVTLTLGRITKIDAAPVDELSNPLTDGWICKKVKHHADRVYSPERIMTPLIRVGAKGNGEFRSATWDEALDLVAEKIKSAVTSHGVDSVLPYLYNSSAPKLEANYLTPHLFARLGAPEILHTICAASYGAAWDQMFGEMLSIDTLDVVDAKLVVVWGANPAVSGTHLLPLLAKVQKAGGKLVVVDPRKTGTASRADLHLAVRPGTDVVLAYALANELARTGKVATQFLESHTTGSKEFLAAASKYSLEDASKICDISLDKIREMFELIANTQPAVLRMGYGPERNRNGGSGVLAVLGLWLVAGHFGTNGSGILASTSDGFSVDVHAPWPKDVAQPTQKTLNMNHVGRVLRGDAGAWPVEAKVFLVQGANPAVTAVDQVGMLAGLANEEIFTVVHDQVLTDTAKFADVVLPATTHFEVHDLVGSYGSYAAQVISPVIERVGESRTNNELAAGLATRLGFSADEFNGDPQSIADRIAEQKKHSLQLRKTGTTVQFKDTWPTFADKRARLYAAESELPLPQYRAADEKYPLVLISPATSHTINSMFADTDPPRVAISMHPRDAAQRKLIDAKRVIVRNDVAQIEIDLVIDETLRPGVCFMPKGLWLRATQTGLTSNAFAPDELNDLASGACFNDARVEVTVA
ncbi:MAG: molybdopterin-dependent oxidoreductase [Actinobacteria bacterium]|nr:molybdopterin-dependent oxidoreductase [Actinomycetota bacterium]MDA3016586.1 molybdopterin-dependent oxidoreductase [Actinomycetota bacterium]